MNAFMLDEVEGVGGKCEVAMTDYFKYLMHLFLFYRKLILPCCHNELEVQK
jgi:hypothetical protein